MAAPIRTTPRRRGRSASATLAEASGEVLRPRSATPVALWVSLTCLLLTSTLAFLRLGTSSWRGTVWAEDGGTFLLGAYDTSLLGGVLDEYAGYAHVLPRLNAELLTLLPLSAQGLAVVVSAALARGAIALFTFHVVRAHATRSITAWFAAVAVAVVPVGPETVNAIANDQWYLLVSGCLAPFWRPQGRAGVVASAVALAAVATSCPFGLACAALAGLVALLTRHRDAVLLAAVGVVGSLLQLLVVALAPPRPRASEIGWASLAAGYPRRVLADGTFGTWRHHEQVSTSIVAGVAVLVVVLTAAWLVSRSASGPRVLVVPAILLAMSWALYAAPIAISGAPTDSPLISGRYFVAPVALFLIAVALVADRRLTSQPLPALGGLVLRAVIAASVVGMATSWQVPGSDPRLVASSWATLVADARERCATMPATSVQSIAISPPGWMVELQCSELEEAS